MRLNFRLTIMAALALFCGRGVAAEPPFVFNDVAQETGIADALRGMMGHAASRQFAG